MRIGLIGDIHGNIVAAEQCYAVLKGEGCDTFFHTGDIVGFGPFPNECVAFIRAHEIPGVRGNYDENAAYKSEDCGCDFVDPREREAYEATFVWTRDQLDPAARSLLVDLPFDIQFRKGEHDFSIFHANPFDIYTSISEDRSEAFMKEIAGYTGASINIFSHTHIPFYRKLDGIHFINVGSVGNPKDGDPRASCVILDINGSVRVKILRVEYDVGKVVEAVKKASLPPEIVDSLLNGK